MQSYNISNDILHREKSCCIWRIYNCLLNISFCLKHFALSIYHFILTLYFLFVIRTFNAKVSLQIEYQGSEINGK